MSPRSFFDTNIVVYSLDESEGQRHRIAKALLREGIVERTGAISYQVVQECLNLMLRKFKKPVHEQDANHFLKTVLMPLCSVYPDQRLFTVALEIVAETGWSFYDSLIVSGAIAGNCGRLITEDLQDGRVIRGVKIHNPFK